jgi:hypothetical protein
MPSLTEALNNARTTRNAFNYWMREGALKTEYAETTPGVARELSYENTLEIAFVAALTRAGLTPIDAGERAQQMITYAKEGVLPAFYVLNPITGGAYHFDDLGADLRALTNPLREQRPSSGWSQDHEGEGLTQIAIINCREIERRVESLCKDESPRDGRSL